MYELNPPLDVTLVSGARPDLLERTLRSFHDRMLTSFDVANVFCNIDPVFGGRDEVAACAEIVRRFFPAAFLYMPEKPGFGRAVKRLWMSTGDRHVLHLEDDWDLLARVRPDDVFPLFDHDVGTIQFAIESRESYGGDYLYLNHKRRFLGFVLRRWTVNSYGTSPRLLRQGLALHFGRLLNPRMDPEKQVQHKKNRRLARAHEPWKCRALYASDGRPLVLDTGLNWRAERRIEKVDWRGFVWWRQA